GRRSPATGGALVNLGTLQRQIEALTADVDAFLGEGEGDYSVYREDPSGFARDVLGVTWTPKQEEIALSLLAPPYRTLVKASHNVGKTHLAAGVALWWHCTRRPSIVLSTAPKLDQVKKLLWKEIRTQGRGHVRFAGPAMPYVERAPDDFMLG